MARFSGWAIAFCRSGYKKGSMNLRSLLNSIVGIVSFFGIAVTNARAQTMATDSTWSVHVTPNTGDYRIETTNPFWTIGGSVGSTLNNLKTTDGRDGIGAYRQVRFTWTDNGRRAGSIRLYRREPIAIFSVTYVDAVDHSPGAFPVLKNLPENLLAFRYGEDAHMHPPMFTLKGKDAKEQYGGPFCLFDHDANAMVISPASNFMVGMLDGDQEQGISCGLNRTLKNVPAGYTQQTILAVGHGINRTWDAWGHALTNLYGKKRPANDADAGLKYLSYWTDNGAAYYYNYDLDKGYANTILAVKKHLDEIGVPIRSMQLDSWWYPKTFKSVQGDASNKPRAKDPRLPAGTWNRYGGMITYTPSEDLFPDGLKVFDQKLGLPLITHSRWIDPTSPYVKEYKVSGIAPVDAKWWDKIIGDIASWGVMTYEQDWNNYIYNLSPELSDTTWAGDAYMDGMARACAAHELTMQYCMILPRNLMQGGAKYANLTTVRLCSDRWERGKWRDFLFGSQMASALGAWPWTDVFRSNETANMLLCDLSAGMVGLADKIGEENVANIFHVARKDGVIVKPDEPLVPMDQTYIAQAEGKKHPLVCATGSRDTKYVFAFQSKPGHGDTTAEFSPEALGISGKIFVYDYFAASGKVADAKTTFSQALNDDGWAYDVVCPIGKSQMALVGDLGLFATCGKQRIAEMAQKADGLHISVILAANEKEVTIAVYAPTKPSAEVKNGTLEQLDYNPATGLARVKIAANTSPRTNGPDATRTMEVNFSLTAKP
jgi:hypothetical protein